MKKNKNQINNENLISIEEINHFLNKISRYGGIIADSDFSEIKDWIDTGNYTLNAVLSGDIFKGIPSGRITLISGLTSTGKTFLSLNAASNAQKKGYFIIWIDSEGAIDKNLIENFDINLKLFRHELMNTVSEVSTFLKKLTTELKNAKADKKQIPKIMIVIDSLGNLSSSKEISDVESGSEKADMTRAKEIKRLFRALTLDLAILDIPMIVINHTYTAINSFIPTQVQGGGLGVQFNPSIILNLFKTSLKEENSKIGINVFCSLEKGRFARTDIKKRIRIRFDRGMNRFYGLESYFDENTFNEIGITKGKYIKSKDMIEFDDSDDCKSFVVRDKDTNEIKNLKASEFFNSKIFTDEVLNYLNEKVKKIHKYSKDLDTNIEIYDSEDDEI